MKFVKPKNLNKQKVEVAVSSRTKLILESYAKYTGYEEGEVLDLFLENLMLDHDFIQWITKQRFNKKLQTLLVLQQEGGAQEDGEHKETCIS